MTRLTLACDVRFWPEAAVKRRNRLGDAGQSFRLRRRTVAFVKPPAQWRSDVLEEWVASTP